VKLSWHRKGFEGFNDLDVCFFSLLTSLHCQGGEEEVLYGRHYRADKTENFNCR
jgi:hypothetical protein